MLFHPLTVYTHMPTRLGTVHLAASPIGLCGLWFSDQRHRPPQLTGDAPPWPGDARHPVLQAAQEQLTRYLDNRLRVFDLPLDLSSGTPFQQSVWRELLALPCGATSSYGEIARRIGKPQAVRAVGAAVGRNPLSVVVPCHRVLGGQGQLTGYAGGLDRKVALLSGESAWPVAAADAQVPA